MTDFPIEFAINYDERAVLMAALNTFEHNHRFADHRETVQALKERLSATRCSEVGCAYCDPSQDDWHWDEEETDV
jgi:hypothetical protein